MSIHGDDQHDHHDRDGQHPEHDGHDEQDIRDEVGETGNGNETSTLTLLEAYPKLVGIINTGSLSNLRSAWAKHVEAGGSSLAEAVDSHGSAGHSPQEQGATDHDSTCHADICTCNDAVEDSAGALQKSTVEDTEPRTFSAIVSLRRSKGGMLRPFDDSCSVEDGRLVLRSIGSGGTLWTRTMNFSSPPNNKPYVELELYWTASEAMTGPDGKDFRGVRMNFIDEPDLSNEPLSTEKEMQLLAVIQDDTSIPPQEECDFPARVQIVSERPPDYEM